jgi:hypothetical protein
VCFGIQDSGFKGCRQVQRIEPALIPSRKEYFDLGFSIIILFIPQRGIYTRTRGVV